MVMIQLRVPSRPIKSSALRATFHLNTSWSGWVKGALGGISRLDIGRFASPMMSPAMSPSPDGGCRAREPLGLDQERAFGIGS